MKIKMLCLYGHLIELYISVSRLPYTQQPKWQENGLRNKERTERWQMERAIWNDEMRYHISVSDHIDSGISKQNYGSFDIKLHHLSRGDPSKWMMKWCNSMAGIGKFQDERIRAKFQKNSMFKLCTKHAEPLWQSLLLLTQTLCKVYLSGSLLTGGRFLVGVSEGQSAPAGQASQIL